MGVDDLQARIARCPQFGQTVVVVADFRPVVGDDALHSGESDRRSAVSVDLPVVVERVAGVQDPAVVAGVDRDCGVTATVARQGQQNDSVGDLGQFGGGGEAVPLVADLGMVANQVGVVVALGR